MGIEDIRARIRGGQISDIQSARKSEKVEDGVIIRSSTAAVEVRERSGDLELRFAVANSADSLELFCELMAEVSSKSNGEIIILEDIEETNFSASDAPRMKESVLRAYRDKRATWLLMVDDVSRPITCSEALELLVGDS